MSNSEHNQFRGHWTVAESSHPYGRSWKLFIPPSQPRIEVQRNRKVNDTKKTSFSACTCEASDEQQ